MHDENSGENQKRKVSVEKHETRWVKLADKSCFFLVFSRKVALSDFLTFLEHCLNMSRALWDKMVLQLCKNPFISHVSES